MRRNRTGENGFTLIELLIAMALALLLMSGIYYTYWAQQKIYQVQDQVVAMQQNLRAAMHYIERDLRIAGFDDKGINRPSGQKAGIGIAEPNRITFSLYGGGNCQPDADASLQVVTYEIYDSGAVGPDTLGKRCGDDVNANIEPIAPGIEVMDFVYLGVDEDNGNVIDLDTDGDGDVDAGDDSDIDDIRWIEVTLVARTPREDPDYTDTASYQNRQGEEILAPQNDHYRRKSISVRILVRNLMIEYAS